MVKKPPAVQEVWVRLLIGKIPWRKAWQPTSVFLPGESHGQRSLVGYSPKGHKESDVTERQTGIKIAGRNINNLRYADGTTLMAESKEELKSLLMKVKEES